jgi:hypothetical protein
MLRYVKLEYIATNSLEEAEKLLQASENEFIEGLMFDKSSIVVMYGNFVNRLSTQHKVW